LHGSRREDARISQVDLRNCSPGDRRGRRSRSEAEFTRGHVPGAISLTDADLSARTAVAVRAIAALKKSKLPIVVYCACPAELTSLRVAEALRSEGLADARALTGGWVEWFNAGNPVETGR
jgi:rhodanese-related sulfurtransferase